MPNVRPILLRKIPGKGVRGGGGETKTGYPPFIFKIIALPFSPCLDFLWLFYFTKGGALLLKKKTGGGGGGGGGVIKHWLTHISF